MRIKVLRCLCVAAAAAALLCVSLGAQGTGTTAPGAGGGATTPSTPTTPSPGTTTPPTRIPLPTAPQQSRTPEMERPVFISGRVQLEDGTAPSEPVMIERVCNGRVHQEGFTDSKGRFTIQLGQNRSAFPDASIGSSPEFGTDDSGFGSVRTFGRTTGVSERELANCEIRANLPGYRSDIVPMFGRRSLDNPEIGSIILRRYGNVSATTVSATTLGAPKEAKKAYEKGLEAKRKQKWADSRKQFERAVAVYPEFADAWFELGLAADRLNDVGAARSAYLKAVELDAKFIKPHLQLAALAAKAGDWKELAGITGRILEMDPYNYPGIYYFDAVAEYNLGRLDQAETSARQAVKLDKTKSFPSSNHILGVVLAVKGELDEAAGALKEYLRLSPEAPDAAQARTRLAEVERVAAARRAQAR